VAASNDLANLHSILQHGTLELEGQFMLGSNYTFLVNVRHSDKEVQAVYKPSQGEQPLWDFPGSTLAHREVAAHILSQALGWDFVPYTILREDGPYGPGSLQQFIDYDPNYHYFTFSEVDKARLAPVMCFDLLCNNADRKGSHIIIEKGTGKLWLIDHGVCFHEEDKLRTVIWDYAGQAIPQILLDDISRFTQNRTLLADLEPHLSPNEVTALFTRAQGLLTSRTFPLPPEDRRAFPYPPL